MGAQGIGRNHSEGAEILDLLTFPLSEARPMSTYAADNPLRPVTSFWWLFMLFGVATLGVGVFFVVSPHETLSTFTVIAGIFLLVDGVLAILASVFNPGEGRGLLALIGVFSVSPAWC